MSHIAEGLLHAHLDGAIGHDRAEEWLLAEAHLGDCEDCRRRLEEARQVRGAAGEILALATVPAERKPNFEDLLEQANGTSRSPRRTHWWSSTPRLAWAASLMLAAGAGWLGRELLIQTGQDVPAVVAESEAIPQAPEQTAGFADALEADEATAGDRQVRGGADDADMVSGERAAEPAVAAMQKSGAQRSAEEFRQDAAPEEVKVDRLEAEGGAARERDVAAPTCYAADAAFESQRDLLAADEVTRDPDDEKNESFGALNRLRLAPDGTTLATVNGRQVTGTWVETSADSIQVLLADGEPVIELRLGRMDTGLTGTAVPVARDHGLANADKPVASPTVSIRLLAVECGEVE